MTGEQIDTARLAAWMDEAALPGKGEPLSARFLSGGTQNVIGGLYLRLGDNFGFTFGSLYDVNGGQIVNERVRDALGAGEGVSR